VHKAFNTLPVTINVYPNIFETSTRFLNTRLLSPPGERIEVRGRSFLSPLILTFSPHTGRRNLYLKHIKNPER
jgi:hypothetical protein